MKMHLIWSCSLMHFEMDKVYVDTEALQRTVFRADRRKTGKLYEKRVKVRMSKGHEK